MIDPYNDVDLVCRFREDDTPFTTQGTGSYTMADCQDSDGKEYEFILPGAV